VPLLPPAKFPLALMTNGVPVPVKINSAMPLLRVALVVTVNTVATVTVVPLLPLSPSTVEKVVEPLPMVRFPKVMVPEVPEQEAALAPIQLLPEVLESTGVVPPEDWVKVWDAATLIFPELALALLPTVKLLPAMAKVPPETTKSCLASTSNVALNVPVPLMVKL